MIAVTNLAKAFRGTQALRGVSLRVGAGELFGLLGPNGAGKTTAIRILCGLLAPDAGTARIGGVDVAADPLRVREIIGVVHQSPSLDRRSTVRENLEFHCRIYRVPRAERPHRIAQALRLAGLEDAAGRPAGTLSGGQRRRLEIARALLHRPRVLLLDEPTTGLDPASRQAIWRFVAELREREGVTVVFTTHYLAEAEPCDRVAVLDRGRVIAEGTPAELRSRVPSGFCPPPPPRGPTLEDVYLYLTGPAGRGEAV